MRQQQSESPTTSYLPPSVSSLTGPGSEDADVDGGEWVTVTTLPQRTNHVIPLPARRLVDAVRLRKTTGVLSVYELEVLAPANY